MEFYAKKQNLLLVVILCFDLFYGSTLGESDSVIAQHESIDSMAGSVGTSRLSGPHVEGHNDRLRMFFCEMIYTLNAS